MTGGLFDPLGTDRPERARRAPSPLVVVAGLSLAALAALLGLSWLRDAGDRGRPIALAPIERPPAPTTATPAEPAAAVVAPPAPPPAPPPAQAAAPGQPAPPAPPAVPPAGSVQTIPPVGLPPPSADQDVQIENGVRVVRPRRDGRPPSPAPSPAASPAATASPTASPLPSITFPPPADGGRAPRVPDRAPP